MLNSVYQLKMMCWLQILHFTLLQMCFFDGTNILFLTIGPNIPPWNIQYVNQIFKIKVMYLKMDYWNNLYCTLNFKGCMCHLNHCRIITIGSEHKWNNVKPVTHYGSGYLPLLPLNYCKIIYPETNKNINSFLQVMRLVELHLKERYKNKLIKGVL